MIESGRVITVNGRLVTIRQDKSPDKGDCFGCMNHTCRRAGGFIQAINSRGLPLETGQHVETEIRAVSLFVQSLQALLPPVLGFIAGFYLWRLMFPASGEGGQTFAGAILMLAAGLGFYLFRRRFPVKMLPVISAVLDGEDGAYPLPL